VSIVLVVNGKLHPIWMKNRLPLSPRQEANQRSSMWMQAIKKSALIGAAMVTSQQRHLT